jgi:hypothetical protein
MIVPWRVPRPNCRILTRRIRSLARTTVQVGTKRAGKCSPAVQSHASPGAGPAVGVSGAVRAQLKRGRETEKGGQAAKTLCPRHCYPAMHHLTPRAESAGNTNLSPVRCARLLGSQLELAIPSAAAPSAGTPRPCATRRAVRGGPLSAPSCRDHRSRSAAAEGCPGRRGNGECGLSLALRHQSLRIQAITTHPNLIQRS